MDVKKAEYEREDFEEVYFEAESERQLEKFLRLAIYNHVQCRQTQASIFRNWKCFEIAVNIWKNFL